MKKNILALNAATIKLLKREDVKVRKEESVKLVAIGLVSIADPKVLMIKL